VNPVVLHLDDRAEGIAIKVWGDLDVESGAELETFLLLEASLQPEIAVLDLGQLDSIHPCVEAHLATWQQAFADVGSELVVVAPPFDPR
jgi:hypothetical protein